MNAPYVTDRSQLGSSSRERARGRRWWHCPARQVAGSPGCVDSAHFSLSLLRLAVFWFPLYPGKRSLISEMEATVAYEMIAKAFGGGGASLFLQDFGPAWERVIFMFAQALRLYPSLQPVWILFSGDGP